jgi:ABC-type multidrug transport system ATPase subunit
MSNSRTRATQALYTTLYRALHYYARLASLSHWRGQRRQRAASGQNAYVAGKSTTMRVVVGLDAPDTGTATIGGRPYRSLQHPLTHVGSLLDAGALQPGRSARNHLLWLAHSQGIKAGRVEEVIALAGLEPAARRKAGGYSLGMRQRLGIAAALLGDPPVLIFDEPYNGMDPEGIVWMKGFLRVLAAQGRAVLVSSHLMSELEDTAGHLVVIGRGRVIADTSVADLLAAASGNRIMLRTTAPADAMTARHHDRRNRGAVPLPGDRAAREFLAPGARRVDQVPHRARLGDRGARLDPGDYRLHVPRRQYQRRVHRGQRGQRCGQHGRLPGTANRAWR